MTSHWTGHLLLGLILAVHQEMSIAEIDFVVSPQSQTVLYGDDVILNCQAKDMTNPSQGLTYSWYLNSGPRPQGSSVYLNNSLLLQNIQPSHLGNYSCVILDSKGISILAESAPAQILHAYINNFVLYPRGVDVMEGETIKLECVTGESSPPPEIFWERNNKVFTSGSQYNTTYKSSLPSGIIQQLSMKLVMVALPSDSGLYSCVASNPMLNIKVRSLEWSINITAIQTKPYVDSLQYNRNVLSARDMPLTLPCPILGYPVPVISWQKENVPVKDTSDHYVMSNGSLHIKSLQLNDEAYYVCEGTNPLGTIKSPEIVLQMAYIEIDFRMDPYSRYALAGRPVTLPCSPPLSYPPANVTWYKNNQLMTFDIDNKTFIVDPAYGVWDLFFTSIQKQDEGRYFCIATNNFSEPMTRTSKIATINVGGAPTFVEPPLSQTVVMGDGLQLKCIVVGDPFPEISWQLDRIPIDEGPQVSLSSDKQELHITNINKAWEGVYTCTASNMYDTTTATALVDVIAPPAIINPISNQTVLSGNDIILTCEVTGDPTPVVTWYKDNSRLLFGAHHTLTVTDLTIHNVSLFDRGLYKCEATNDGGSARSEGYLIVNVLPFFIKWPEDVDIIIGGSLNFLCEVDGYPTPVTQWLFNGTNLFPTGVLISPNHLLTVPVVTWQHVGTYTCVAASDIGTTSKSAKLSLLIPPSIISITGDSVVFMNTNTELSCVVYGIPTPTLQWYRHGNPVTSSSDGRIMLGADNFLTIKFARPSDAGEYKCISVNIAGKTEKSAMVYVIGPPVPPLLLDPVSQSATSVTVRWVPATQQRYTPVSHYVIYYREKSAVEDIRYPVIVNSTMLSADILSLSPGTQYYFSVSSVNQAGEGVKSNIKLAKTFDSGPTEPRNLVVIGTNATAVKLRWEIPANTNGQIRKYKILYNKQNSATVPTAVDLLTQMITASVSYVVTGLQPFSVYEFSVQAATTEQDLDMWGTQSNIIVAQTGISAPTGSPQSVQTTVVSAYEVRVTWQPVLSEQQNGPIKSYLIKYTKLGVTQAFGSINVSASHDEVKVTNLLPWSQYSFVVEAENDGGIGPGSTALVVKTAAAAPSASPRNLQLQSISESTITVYYKFPDENTWNSEVSGIILEVQTVSNDSVDVIRYYDTVATSYNISQLKSWTEYRVRVALFTDQISAGQGPFTAWFITRTLESKPGPVSGVSYQVTPTSVQLNWLPPKIPNGIIQGYDLQYLSRVISGDMGNDTVDITTPINDAGDEDISQQRSKRNTQQVEDPLILPDYISETDIANVNAVCDSLALTNSDVYNFIDEVLQNITVMLTGSGSVTDHKQNVIKWTLNNLNENINASQERTVLTDVIHLLLDLNINVIQWIVQHNSSIRVICYKLEQTRMVTNETEAILKNLHPSTTYLILIAAYTTVGFGNITHLTVMTGYLPGPPPDDTTSPVLGQTSIGSLGSSAASSSTDMLPAILAGCASGVLLILFILILILCVCIRRKARRDRVLYDEKTQEGIFGDIPQDRALSATAKNRTTEENNEGGTRFSTGVIDITGDTVKYGTNSTTSRQEYRFMKESQSVPASVNYNMNITSDRDSNISGIENPGYHHSEKDNESIAVSLTLSAEEVYSQASNTLNRKSRMRSESAAAIAVMRNKSIPVGLSVDDTDSLINNDTVVVYAERTAL